MLLPRAELSTFGVVAAKAIGEIRCLVMDEVHNVLGDRHTEAAWPCAQHGKFDESTVNEAVSI